MLTAQQLAYLLVFDIQLDTDLGGVRPQVQGGTDRETRASGLVRCGPDLLKTNCPYSFCALVSKDFILHSDTSLVFADILEESYRGILSSVGLVTILVFGCDCSFSSCVRLWSKSLHVEIEQGTSSRTVPSFYFSLSLLPQHQELDLMGPR